MPILESVSLKVLTLPAPDDLQRLIVISSTLYSTGRVVGPPASIGLIPASTRLGEIVSFYGGTVGLQVDKVRIDIPEGGGKQEIIVKTADGKEIHSIGRGTINISLVGVASVSLLKWLAIGGLILGLIKVAGKKH